MRRTALAVAVPLVCALVVSGCSSGKGSQNNDDLQIVANPVAATAPVSPVPAVAPAGTILPSGPVTAMASAGGLLAVAVDKPPAVLLYSLAGNAPAPKRVDVDGPVENLSADNGQVLASIPSRGEVVRIAADGTARPLPVAGQPADAVTSGGNTLVAVRDRKVIDVYRDGQQPRTISGGLYSADQVVDAQGHVVMLDRLRTAVFSVDVAGGSLGEGLRAGDGAANAVADSYGRVLVTDARTSSLLAFSTNPLLLRQMYPVPGGAYGIAYDATRHLAWVTLTAANEVVAYDVRGGEPTEKHRYPTVRQPDSVAVDSATGKVYVGSATGEGIQVIQP